MMMRGSIKGKGVFVSQLLSYISILLIPFLINIFAYYQSINIIEYEINRAHAISLRQVQQIIDSRLADMLRLSTQVTFNEKVVRLGSNRRPMSSQQTYDMVKIIEDIKTYKIANAYIDQLYIYYKAYDFILSENGKCSTREFYDFYCKGYAQDYGTWLRMLNNSAGSGHITSDATGANPSNKILLLKFFPIEYNDFFDGTIVFCMDGGTLKRRLEDISWNYQGTLMVTDHNNDIITSTGEFYQPDMLDTGRRDEKERVFYQNINGRGTAVSYFTSSIADWKYISVIPTQVFLDQAKYIKKVIAVSACLCLLIGGFISVLWAKRNYNPVKRMVDILVNKAGMSSDSRNSEFKFIEQSILHVLDEKDRIGEQLKRQKDILRDNYIEKLVKGSLKLNATSRDSGRYYNICFKHEHYAVILFYYIEECKNIFYEQSDSTMEKALEITYFIIKNVVEELVNQYGTGYMAEIDNSLVCIANFEEAVDIKQTINSIIDKAGKFLQEKFGIEFLVSVSGIHSGYENISVAYQEAIEAFEYTMIIGKNERIHFDDIDTSNLMNHGSTFSDQQKFINAVMVDDYKEAGEILNNILKKDFSQYGLSVQMLRCKIFSLIHMMILAMDQAGIDYKEEFWEKMNPVEKLLKCNTVNELRKQLKFVLSQMDNHAAEVRKMKNENLYNDIVGFVNKNYTDVNLSVSLIAENFNINASYLSRLFKKNRGQGLLDFIHSLRIEKAKKLMESSDLCLKEIGDSVGYYNNIAFIRAFKRQEGMAPGQYKDMVRGIPE